MTMKIIVMTMVICLANLSALYAGGPNRNDHRLTCKYFDSLSQDRNSCSMVNRGRTVDIKKEGPPKSLYLASMKAMDSGADFEEWRKSKYYSKGTMSFDTWMIDLNGDGIEEAIVFPRVSDFRGASGNGDIFVLKRALDRKSDAWKLIGALSGNALYIEPRKTNGYFVAIAHWDMGAATGYLTRCKMSNKTGKYEMVSGREYWCTIESQKPCF